MRDREYGHGRALRAPLGRSLGALLLVVALGACGNVTVGGVTEADVYMSGDADGSGPAAAPDGGAAPVESSSSASSPSAAIVGAGLEGDVEVTASFYLSQGGGTFIPLSPNGDVTVTLDLAGAAEPRVAQEQISAGAYEGVRVVFTSVVADVTGGLEIGGVPITGTVTVDLGTDGVIVDRSFAIQAEEDLTLALLVDLDADAWLDLADPLSKTVAAADFASAVVVTLR